MNAMIAWFARNDVAANLLMFLILGLGAFALKIIPLEVFPEFESDIVEIAVPFRGATPTEVESGVILRIEDAIADLEGIKKISSVAREAVGTVAVEVDKGYDPRVMLEDLKTRVDAISTFPAESENPVIRLAQRQREVISVVIFGELSERELRELGERVRDDLTDLPEISQVEMSGVRPYEITIEISESTLQEYGLKFSDISNAIKNTSIDLSAGVIKSSAGEILISTRAQAYQESEFASIPVVTTADGTRLTLKDIATVRDGFEDTTIRTDFNRNPSVLVDVYRVGDQNAIDIANSVKQYIDTVATTLPPGVSIDYWRDRSRIIKSRLGTLTNSAIQGGLIIFFLLALFLRFSVALWVCIGIPISFMGAIALMPEIGVTINIVSLFAFIVVLGIVVDDAIVTGENIYTHLKRNGGDSTQAAINGAQEVAVPVTFGILTTVTAFLPLFMIAGDRGKIFAQIPAIVIPVLLFSLVESKLILPAHLKHLKTKPSKLPVLSGLVRLQRRIADGFENVINNIYRPLLAKAIRYRYLTLSIFLAVAIVIFSLVKGGHIGYVFFPKVQSETARAFLTMPAGTAFEITEQHIQRITAEAEALREKYIDPETNESIIQGILSNSGSKGGSTIESSVGRVVFEITSPEKRSLTITSSELVREWRKEIGNIPGVEELTFRAEIGRAGDPIDIQLNGTDTVAMKAISETVKQRLREYPGLFDISDTLEGGKEEIELKIKPEAEILGISQADLAQQVRAAFFGLEAQRIQRGRDDVRVMVRYPENERSSLNNLQDMYIRAPDGTEIPFNEVAEYEVGQSPAKITRIDRRRTLNIKADANKETTDLEAIKRDLGELLPQLVKQYSGITYSLEGEAREQRESFASLKSGMIFVLFTIYALLAIPFRSYIQPLTVMLAIPFGMVGAVLGHIILDMTLSISSLLGMLALTGVVVNDSLVLVDYINKRRREGMSTHEAVTTAGAARFRAVWLTSLTTFAGLMPLIFEKSTQAQFLIPMAVSLGFGILFATFITLLLVPINYLLLDDLKNFFSGIWKAVRKTTGAGSTT